MEQRDGEMVQQTSQKISRTVASSLEAHSLVQQVGSEVHHFPKD